MGVLGKVLGTYGGLKMEVKATYLAAINIIIKRSEAITITSGPFVRWFNWA